MITSMDWSYIDFKNSFDTIDHQIVLRKLKIYRIDQNSLIWFQSNLTTRTQKCRINGKLPNSAPITCGVPQSNNLEPFVFLIYVNDSLNCFNHTVPRIFADDTKYVSAMKHRH